jgi:membrane protein DedA with SNARE-associated domain
VLYAALLVTIGRLVGESAAEVLERPGRLRLLVLVGPLALVSLVGYRLYKRRRYGVAKAATLEEGAGCLLEKPNERPRA